jgi:hypothetical protein
MREGFLGFAIFLLFVLIALSFMKLWIFFETFMLLQKKQNFDKANYLSNSSFFKYYYRNKLGGSIAIESAISAILLLLAFFAIVGWVGYGHINYGYLNYYYGDVNEYYFINMFIYLIVFLLVVSSPTLVASFVISTDAKSDLLIQKEKELKEFFADNLDYELLYDYYTKTKDDVAKAKSYSFDKNISTKNSPQLFNFCFTYHILTDDRFALIKDDLFNLIKNINVSPTPTPTPTDELKGQIKSGGATIDLSDTKIKDAILNATDFYIIARYNHNNNIAIPSLQTIMTVVKTTMKDEASKAFLNSVILGTNGTINMNEQHEKTIGLFRDTIKIYKDIYDAYYSYYILSILITNFFVMYAVMVFIFLIIKIALNYELETVENGYNTYYYFQYLKNTGVYILLVYYFLTCPIIIFGFN